MPQQNRTKTSQSWGFYGKSKGMKKIASFDLSHCANVNLILTAVIYLISFKCLNNIARRHHRDAGPSEIQREGKIFNSYLSFSLYRCHLYSDRDYYLIWPVSKFEYRMQHTGNQVSWPHLLII